MCSPLLGYVTRGIHSLVQGRACAVAFCSARAIHEALTVQSTRMAETEQLVEIVLEPPKKGSVNHDCPLTIHIYVWFRNTTHQVYRVGVFQTCV